MFVLEIEGHENCPDAEPSGNKGATVYHVSTYELDKKGDYVEFSEVPMGETCSLEEAFDLAADDAPTPINEVRFINIEG